MFFFLKTFPRTVRLGEADSYQKLRQIYRDIQNGAKAFLAAEYRMCVAFIAVFGFAMIFFVARVDGRGGGNPGRTKAALIVHRLFNPR